MAKSDAIWKWALLALVITGVMTWLVLQPASTKKAAPGDPRPRLFLDRDTHDFGAVMSGEKPIKQSGPDIAYVRESRWARRKTDTDIVCPGDFCKRILRELFSITEAHFSTIRGPGS